jgi:hypothetical protein
MALKRSKRKRKRGIKEDRGKERNGMEGRIAEEEDGGGKRRRREVQED